MRKVRLDRKATSISLLVVLGVRADGQKVLLSIKGMGGESAEAWRSVLDDLTRRGLQRPEFLIVDGAPGLDSAIAAVWDGVPAQRCTVHKHRNLLAHAPERLHQEITADYNDMIYAETSQEIEARRKAFIRKWRVKHRAVADSLEEAGSRLFSFTRLPPEQWKSARTTNAIERLHEEFKRRIKTQTVLPSADTAAMLFWALLASGQISMVKLTAGEPSPKSPSLSRLTSPPDKLSSNSRSLRYANSNHIPDSTVFEAARTCLVFALQKATVTQEVMNAFHIGVADAVFLFDSDIEEYLDRFRKQMTNLQMINYSISNVGPDEHERRGQLADRLAAQVELVNKELPVLIEKFKSYLKLGNI